jgi:hypothetical protein
MFSRQTLHFLSFFSIFFEIIRSALGGCKYMRKFLFLSFVFHKIIILSFLLSPLKDTGRFYTKLIGQKVSSAVGLLGSFTCNKKSCLKQCQSLAKCYLAVVGSSNGVNECQLFNFMALNSIFNQNGYDIYRLKT